MQAADLLAWQITKYVKCICFENRKKRRDFASLLDVPHFFNYFTCDQKRGPLVTFDKRPEEANPIMDTHIIAMFGNEPIDEETLEFFYRNFAENKQR